MKFVSLILFFCSFANAGDNWFSPGVENRLDQIVSVFENSDTNIRYDYIENLNDGRGFTAGKVGFTTATGDLYLVATRYSGLHNFLTVLRERAESNSASTLGLEDLPAVWKHLALDAKFKAVQDQVAEELYRRPARNYLKQIQYKSALTYLIFYDTLVQHGNGDDADGFTAILNRVSTATDEKTFLLNFLQVREQVLLNPANPDTADEWRESVDRVYALKRLVLQKKFNLDGSLQIQVWNRTFNIN